MKTQFFLISIIALASANLSANAVNIQQSKEILPLKSGNIVRAQQKIGEVIVSSTENTNRISSLNFSSSLGEKLAFSNSSLVQVKAELLEKNKMRLLNAVTKFAPDWKNANRRFDPVLTVNEKGEARASYEYMDRNYSRIIRIVLDESGNLISKSEILPDSADGRGLVYPRGPKLSTLQEDLLRNLHGDGTLTGSLISIRSAFTQNASAPDLRFLYTEDDQRFEQVQVYYHMEKGLNWLKEATGAELGSPLSVKVRIGENGISNAAFYHRNEIFLGAGDGLIYKDMLKDPSIIVHETMHAVLDRYAGWGAEGEPGAYNEGFADLLTALILDTPNMAEVSYVKGPYRRTLENRYKAYQDFGPGVYRNGTIIASTLWDCREFISRESLALLTVKIAVALGPNAKLDGFWNAANTASNGILSNEQILKLKQAFERRGWKVGGNV